MADDFLSRWSRRKRRVEETEKRVMPEPPDDPAPGAEAMPEAGARQGEAPVLADPGDAAPSAELGEEEIAALPLLESLSAASDLRPFLRAGVPGILRNAALRRMWSLDPSIRDFVSEARDYAYDWNSPGGMPGLGPLLPGDDVEAMMRRIIGKPAEAPAAEEAPTVEDAVEAPETEHQPPETAPFEADSAEADSAEGDLGEADSPATLALSGPTEPSAVLDDPVPRDPVVAETAPAPAAEPAPPEPIAVSRLRRHGGALPG